VGGFLGIGDRLVAVPPSALTWDIEHVIKMDADKARLKGAPQFDDSKWEENMQKDRVASVYRYYNVTPYFSEMVTPRSDPLRDASRHYRRLGYTTKASKIIGMTVKNLQDETVGKVDNLLINLPAGRVAEVVVSAGGFLGIGDELNAMPPSSFHYNATRDAIVLDATKESLTKAPRFKSTEWPSPDNQEAAVVGVYRYYRIEPYFLTDANNTARNVRDRNNNTLTPFDQGTSEADIALTRDIRKALRKQDGLSVSAQNVTIITRDGRVTVRGPVSSDEEKATIEEIVGRFASAPHIDSQLEVKRGDVNK
jgi:stress response protein YsnF